MSTETEFLSFVEKGKTDREYKNYLEAREQVFIMLDNGKIFEEDARPSLYWKHELAGFEYMLDASPLVIEKLRHHCYHISGLRDYDYRPHHGHMAALFERKLRLLQAQDTNNLGVSENPALGGFGFEIDGALYNLDTLRYYECLLAMDSGTLLNQFRDPERSERKIVVEIGAGWGGFAYQFKTLFPNTTYVIVDFPSTILFSAMYLKTVFPQAKTLFLSGGSDSSPYYPITDYDFVFAPHFAWPRLTFDKPDLLINMVSFQEMTNMQVEQYIKKAADWGVPHLYSMNRDRSRHNKELGTVSAILNKYYTTDEIRVLQISSSRLPTNMLKYYLQPVKRLSSGWLGWPKHKSHHDYRHVIGRLI